MKPITLLIIFLIISSLAFAVTLDTGTELWSDTGSHINVTAPFRTNLTEVSANQINISSETYQAINIQSLNNSVKSNITFKGLGDYSQIFNQTSIYPEIENTNNYMQNISPMNRSIIFILEKPYPRWLSIDKSINTIVYNYSNNNLSVNITITGTGVAILNTSKLVGYSVYINNSYYERSTNLSYSMTAGNYYLWSRNSTITITVTSPTVTTYQSKDVLISFNATTTADNIGSLWYTDASGTHAYTSQTTVSLIEATHTFTFYANDSYGNTESKTVIFHIDIPDSGNNGGSGGGYITTEPEPTNNVSVTPFTPITNTTAVDKIKDSVNNVKEILLNSIMNPSDFLSQWKQLEPLDRALAIIMLSLVIIFIMFLIFIFAYMLKKPKKQR